MLIAEVFENAKVSRRKLFIPFLTAGDPTLATTLEDALSLTKMGADILEVGVPFSDPVADGPVLQQAAERALQNNISLADCIALVKTLRDRQCYVPVVLYTYYNPILQMGIEVFIQALTHAAIQAVLVVDLPLEEAAQFADLLKRHNIGLVLLISPTTSLARIKAANQLATAFLYYIARTGVTGTATTLTSELSATLSELKKQVNLPVVIGFGFNNVAQISSLKQMTVDGVVVGSALVEIRSLQGRQAMLQKAKDFIKILHAVG